jgi:predicted SnoaL-like aldol condensation-catalyzing enzyme
MSDNIKKNREIVETFCTDVFVNHDLSRLDNYMRDDYIQHNPDVPQGKKGFTEFFKNTFKAIPDFRYTLNKIVVDGDLVMIYCRTTGTHTGGEWLGKQASGNKLDFNVVDIFRIQDGKIAEHWDVADTFSLFRQLGIIERFMSRSD